MREEIEIARNVLNEHSAGVKTYGPAHPLVVAIAKEILTQVEKARADERERCAKICDEWERNGPTHNDKFVARQLGKQIRNKPEKE